MAGTRTYLGDEREFFSRTPATEDLRPQHHGCPRVAGPEEREQSAPERATQLAAGGWEPKFGDLRPHEEGAIVENATRAWDMAFYALPFQEGDRILTARAEYASNAIAFLQVARHHGVSVETVPDDETGQLSVAALREMVDERVKLIAVTHHRSPKKRATNSIIRVGSGRSAPNSSNSAPRISSGQNIVSITMTSSFTRRVASWAFSRIEQVFSRIRSAASA